MHVFFADDAKQSQPSRVRMGPLVASGGLFVHGDRLSRMERALNALCVDAGFPPNEEFKWSPRRDMWMHQNLVAERRQVFFSSIIQTCVDHEAKALVIISDCDSRTPADCNTHEIFVTKMLIERVNNLPYRPPQQPLSLWIVQGVVSLRSASFSRNVCPLSETEPGT